MQDSGLNKITLVGHSLGNYCANARPQILADLVLGAALSLLDSVYLPLFLPDVTFKMVGYGMPRVKISVAF
jgi:hypothetical protein